jgi:hypothetical protein
LKQSAIILEWSVALISLIPAGGLAMAPRLALLSLILAFGVSVAFATVTTVRHVHQENASVTMHAAHS